MNACRIEEEVVSVPIHEAREELLTAWRGFLLSQNNLKQPPFYSVYRMPCRGTANYVETGRAATSIHLPNLPPYLPKDHTFVYTAIIDLGSLQPISKEIEERQPKFVWTEPYPRDLRVYIASHAPQDAHSLELPLDEPQTSSKDFILEGLVLKVIKPNYGDKQIPTSRIDFTVNLYPLYG